MLRRGEPRLFGRRRHEAGVGLDWSGIELAMFEVDGGSVWAAFGVSPDGLAAIRTDFSPYAYLQEIKLDMIEEIVALEGAYHGGLSLAVDEAATWRDLHESLNGLPHLNLLVRECADPECRALHGGLRMRRVPQPFTAEPTDAADIEFVHRRYDRYEHWSLMDDHVTNVAHMSGFDDAIEALIGSLEEQAHMLAHEEISPADLGAADAGDTEGVCVSRSWFHVSAEEDEDGWGKLLSVLQEAPYGEMVVAWRPCDCGCNIGRDERKMNMAEGIHARIRREVRLSA